MATLLDFVRNDKQADGINSSTLRRYPIRFVLLIISLIPIALLKVWCRKMELRLNIFKIGLIRIILT